MEFLAAALIVSGFWALLELVKLFLRSPGRETAAALAPGPGREYVERYAEAFLKLAQSYRDLPGKKERFGDEEMEHIFAVLRQQCRGCSGEEVCWRENYYETCRRIFEQLRRMEEEASLPAEESWTYLDFCLQRKAMETLLREIYLQERTAMLWNNRLMEQRDAAGEQIQDTARLLRQMADRLYQIRELKEKERRRLEKELRYEKVDCLGAWSFRKDTQHSELYLVMQIRDGSCIPAKDMSETISEAAGRPMVPSRDCRLTIKKEPEMFHYVTDTAYQMFCGIARMTRDGELVCGDSFAFWQGDCGQVVMSLADGMGTGAGACRESEKVIELLEQFLEAGFSQDTAMRMINASMVLQDHMRVFSTIDLCMVDLYDGTCRMIKAGACPTFLLQGGEAEVIAGKSLPAGVMRTADYETQERTLKSGDSIIMVTDGILDAMEEGSPERLLETIRKVETANAREFARRLLEQALLRQKLQPQDDMTVLVGQIWKK